MQSLNSVLFAPRAESYFWEEKPSKVSFPNFVWIPIKELIFPESQDFKYLKNVDEVDFEKLGEIIKRTSPYSREYHLIKNILRNKATTEGLETLLDKLSDDIGTLFDCLTEKKLQNLYDTRIDVLEHLPERTSSKGVAPSHIRKTLSVVINFFPHFIDTLLKSCNLIDAGKGPESIFEYSMMIDIYYKLFKIPNTLYLIMGTIVSAAFLPTTGVVIALIVTVSIYLIIRPCPRQIKYAINLTDKNSEPVFAREDEMIEIRKFLDAGKNVILVGETGVGKTKLVTGFAKKIPGKIIFYVNAPGMDKIQFIDPYSVMFGDVRGFENNVIFFIDEICNSNLNGLTGLLNGAIDRGFTMILAVTKKQFENLKEKDPTFTRRFDDIQIKPKSKTIIKALCNHQKDMIVEDSVFSMMPESTSQAVDLLESARQVVMNINKFESEKTKDCRRLYEECQETLYKTRDPKILQLSKNLKESQKNDQLLIQQAKKVQALIRKIAFFDEINIEASRSSNKKMLYFLDGCLLPWLKKEFEREKEMCEIPVVVNDALISSLSSA